MSIADKLTYLNQTKQLIKESINLTGANITNEPFRDYAVMLRNKLPELVGDPSPIWFNYEHVSGSGTSFSINSYNSIFNYNIKGDTVQDGTPTPDAPIPVNVVSGNNEVDIVGKNLFDIQKLVKGRLDNGVIGYASGTTDLTLNENSFSFTTNANYRGVVDEDYITLEPSTDYVFKCNVSSGLDIRLSYYDSSKTFISSPNPTSLTDGSKKFTSPSNAKYGRIGIQLNSSGTITIEKPQLEKSSTLTTYEPYRGGIYPINLGDIELCKIGDYQDYIYKDNRSWYLHKEVGKVVLDGTNIPFTIKSASTANDIWVTNNIFEINDYARGYSNHFKVYTSSLYGVNEIGIYFESKRIRCGFGANSSMTTLAIANQFLQDNNVEVLYPLKVATDTEITDTNLILQLNSVRLVNGLNNIITVGSDLNPLLNIEAIKYID